MIKHLLVGVLVLVTLIRAYTYNKILIACGPPDIQKIGAEMAQRFTHGGTICARKPLPIWFANECFDKFPMFKYEPIPDKDIVETVRKSDVDLLYLSLIEWKLRPEIRFLQDSRNAPPDFKVVYYNPQQYTIVYWIDRRIPVPPAKP
jgi:hypothetical protein